MATTQKMYLGNDEIGITRFGEDGNIINGAFTYILDIDYLVVAGGAGGGPDAGSNNAGGGGAGRFVSSSYSLEYNDTLSATIGSGGSIGNDGNDSSLIGSGLTIRMNGGGAGVNSGDGQDGGSGGGAAVPNNSGGSATNGGLVSDLAGIGNNGGSSGAGDADAGNGGGVSTQWFDGVTYCVGGPKATGPSASTTPGSGGHGGTFLAPNTATAGQNGIVKIRYAGRQQATGGTITQSGGYTYHTFTTGGTFTVTG